MNETTKALARRAADDLFREVFQGRCIDVGGGNDPLRATPEFPNLQVEFVVDIGGTHPNLARLNAECLGESDIFKDRAGQYDLVYSSQTLEHLENPLRAIGNWWRLVKPQGHLVITVPDFVLYEQGKWPHIWNSNHKTAWKLRKKDKEPEGSPGCIPLLELVQSLPNADVRRCELVDTGYDYLTLARVQSGEIPPVDLTMPPHNAEAWLEAVVQKTK